MSSSSPLSALFKRKEKPAVAPAPAPKPYQIRHAERDSRSCIPINQRLKIEASKYRYRSVSSAPLWTGKRDGMFLGRAKGRGKVIEGSSSSGRSLGSSGLDGVLEEDEVGSGYEGEESLGLSSYGVEEGEGVEETAELGSQGPGFAFDFGDVAFLGLSSESSGGVPLTAPALPQRRPVSALPPTTANDFAIHPAATDGKQDASKDRRDTQDPLPSLSYIDRNRSITYEILDGTAPDSHKLQDGSEYQFAAMGTRLQRLRREKRYWSHGGTIPDLSGRGSRAAAPTLEDEHARGVPFDATSPKSLSKFSASSSEASASVAESKGGEEEVVERMGSVSSETAMEEVKSVRIRAFQGVKKIFD